ncbi:MAG: hypothetical protein R3A52_27040 [Polyangiales bacterium]
MRSHVALLAASTLALFSTAAHAQTYALQPPSMVQPNGDVDRFFAMVHVPIGLSFALPFGDLDGANGTGFSENAGVVTSFELGAGLRVGRVVGDLIFAIGGAGGSGPIHESIRAAGFDASGSIRIFFGVDGSYYLRRTESWAPWIGLRFGYELLGFYGDRGDANLSLTWGGIYMAARSGIDWRITQGFGLGAYLELGLGRALSASAESYVDDDPLTLENERALSSTTTPIDLKGGAFHGSIGLGLRLVIFP